MSLKSEICSTAITSNIASKHHNTQGIEAFPTAHSLTTNNIFISLETVKANTKEAAFTNTFKDQNIYKSMTTITTYTQNVLSSLGLAGNEIRQGSVGKRQKLRENFTSFSPFFISAGIFAIMALLVLFLLFKKKRLEQLLLMICFDSLQVYSVLRNIITSSGT